VNQSRIRQVNCSYFGLLLLADAHLPTGSIGVSDDAFENVEIVIELPVRNPPTTLSFPAE